MEGRTVVVVEDDDHIAELLDLYLGQAGFKVARATTGSEGLALLASGGGSSSSGTGSGSGSGASNARPALAVVDIGLPGDIDGLEVCRRMRAGSGIPVLLLTARGDETDRVVGLELGADDYVTKPFSPRELVARIKAILRRTDGSGAGGPSGNPNNATITVGDTEVDLARHEARQQGGAVSLTPREFQLLAALAENRGIVLSRRQLLDIAWGHDWYGDERTVDVHVRQLRRKLGDGLPLVTLRRAGYRLG